MNELFIVKSSKKIFHANTLTIFEKQTDNSHPYVVRSSLNNGIRGYVIENTDFLNPKNTLSFAQDTFSVFYQQNPYFTGNKVKVLIPKFDNFNRKIAMYIVANFQKVLSGFTWGVNSDINYIENIKIEIPIKNGEIDFDFMESFIAELEAERVRELEAYLKVTGLTDITLTQAEQKAIEAIGGGYELNSKTWKEFKIGDLFDVSGSKTTSKSYLEKIGKGDYPYITTQAINNGIAGFYNYFTEQENCLTIDSAVLGTCFWQNKNFSASDHVEILRPKNFTLNQKIALFFTSLLNKNASILGYSYGMKRNQSRIKNENILLPITTDGEIDFDFMESFISGVQKTSIKGVIELKDKIIEQTKKAI
ncbi:type I restriction/modification system, S subunit [Campylobacter hyointestinalis subsp. lawsonii CCUG 27631]|uniref:restriction endonuclease subunit S n=1 Tax=Campylobacter hyointestinalis TaxID=198 RepID=UPI0007C8A5A3|nr:restriction endonuclease subunit S [Campylobacter hyointestinalis]ANE34999.1 type I restriction/modification system, S subunit [Campylobacter hyointestinalis subsp. lawsonii CCUG 27631]